MSWALVSGELSIAELWQVLLAASTAGPSLSLFSITTQDLFHGAVHPATGAHTSSLPCHPEAGHLTAVLANELLPFQEDFPVPNIGAIPPPSPFFVLPGT